MMNPHDISKMLEPYIRKTVMDIEDSQILGRWQEMGDSDCLGDTHQYYPRHNNAIVCDHCGVHNSRDFELCRCQACGAPLFDTGAR